MEVKCLFSGRLHVNFVCFQKYNIYRNCLLILCEQLQKLSARLAVRLLEKLSTRYIMTYLLIVVVQIIQFTADYYIINVRLFAYSTSLSLTYHPIIELLQSNPHYIINADINPVFAHSKILITNIIIPLNISKHVSLLCMQLLYTGIELQRKHQFSIM